MTNRLLTYLGIFAAIMAFQNCTTKKNTAIHRGYHNMTARFNGYYWSTEAIKEGVYKIEKANKENFDKVLPVYVIANNDNAKTFFPDFDKAIKKSSLVIQRHTIRDKKENEIPAAGKWIDNNWNNIGISHYYKREFFSGIESFEYVARTYKTKDRYNALIWEARSFNEIGAVSQTEPILTLLANDKKLPKQFKNKLLVVKADYYIKRGLNKEAITVLVEASKQKNLTSGLKKKERARYAFIAAQLCEQEKDNKKARQLYTKVISMKPSYDMVFYSKIKTARLFDIKKDNMQKVKANLLRMARDFKNVEYQDVIYYTLGEIEEKEHHINPAMMYYKKSALSSVSNPNQKALSYLKLGEINFDLTNYTTSGAYYDSTVSVLPKDHPDYNNIVNRKRTLETLVGYINTIQYEDSVQKMAKMSESDRNKKIDKIIAKIEEDEQKKKDELENAMALTQNNNSLGTNTTNTATTGGGTTGWYFSSQTAVALRRSQKNVTTIDNNNNGDNTVKNINDPKNGKNKNTPADVKKTRKYYLDAIPLTDSLMKVSHGKIIEADYMLGSTYKEELNNNKRAIAAFEDLNNRYADHKYKLNCYYQLYRIYAADKNQAQSDFYKQKLLNEYPNSEYAKLIKNPKYAEERNAQRSEVENFYVQTFDLYSAGNYNEAYTKSGEGLEKFGKTDFSAKFEFIKAMSTGKVKGIDSLEAALTQLTILYPKSEVTPKAFEILQAIKKQKDPNAFTVKNDSLNVSKDSTYKVNLNAEHFALVIGPDDPKMVNPLKSGIDDFDKQFYSNKNFSISSNLFATAQQMIMVKSFPNAKEGQAYIENLKNDQKVFTGDVKKEAFEFFIISAQNLPAFYKKANVNAYRAFFQDAYKSLFGTPKQ